MRRNCNLELRLMPPSVSSFSPKNCSASYFSMEDKESRELENIKESQELTIFSNGKLVVSDATELQAKDIIYLASREMDEKINKTASKPMTSGPSLPLLQPQTGLFMKKSLQRFLQKRKNRIQTTSPYHR